jgi:amino acid transporter
VHPRFRTPYVSIFVFATVVWLLAWFGTFAGNATLSAGSRLFYYGVICAALPALRRKQGKTAAAFRLRGGTMFAILGVLICMALLTQIEYNKSIVLLAAVAVAFLNWRLVRRRPTETLSH